MTYRNIKKISSAVVFISVLSGIAAVTQSCNEEGDQEGPGFDRGLLLEEMATKLIIPNFKALQSRVNALSAAASEFNGDPSVERLILLRSAWVDAVVNYQHCSAFGFGPGDLTLGPFATVLGVFPVDENQVEQNIIDPDFNLAASFDRDVRGFYAVEYLIYGNGSADTEIVGSFDEGRKAYLELLVNELKTSFGGIVSGWQGGYLDVFIENDGTSAGSPISLMYNEFVKDYENLKNFKVELPAGLTAGQTGADPKLVEAYYSGISLRLIEEHFENSKNIWLGRTREGNDFIGFEEYLETVVGGPDLITKTLEALDRIDNAIDVIPEGRFSDQLEASAVENLRDELQHNTPNFKSSLSSLLGISITFNSGDGD